jgi:type IV secretory pathway TrbD component
MDGKGTMLFILYLCTLALIYSFVQRFWIALGLTVALWSTLVAVFTLLF